MSDAPRTIWTCTHTGEYGQYFPEAVEAEGEYGGTSIAYHHDDVVRELVSIANHALDQWESCIESDYAGTSSYDHMIAEVFERRGALAKTAQEGRDAIDP